ncbi:MAG: hypothetical protein Q9190_000770 [Brigantiaea leucoxantha]
MGPLVAFLISYVLGGLTFFPLVAGLVLLHAYLFFPHLSRAEATTSDSLGTLQEAQDDSQTFKSITALASLGEKFQPSHEPDVAAGYFAVCREYVPGGINGKPPERTTPAGAVVAAESPSVYQSMYRSIFDRKQAPTLDPGKGNGRAVKRARNVFFVVLRHGHLMLYDDEDQLEVRHVISLEHHHVSVYGGEEVIPEGELWIKKNAICLTRKMGIEDPTLTPKPFFLFSENCSDKEDFYLALLHSQESKSDEDGSSPRPQTFEVKDIITLVQKLHSSEEQLQTRWLNALVGRLFLAFYQTTEMEDFIRKKITKKIARVKRPAFLSDIILEKIDMGGAAPYITNPKLKDLTVDGDCCAEADFKYSGNLRLEIAATARIELGARFKAREVNLILAVVVKKLEGHALVKFKPPPSNRLWITFETMPELELAIEPIVSSRQITYNIILRAIESRIREVVAETIVSPHWDDVPFTDTEKQRFRGGIWARSPADSVPSSNHLAMQDEVAEDEIVSIPNSPPVQPALTRSKDDRSTSMPALSEPITPETTSRKVDMSTAISADNGDERISGKGVSSGVQRRSEPPKAIRSRSFASAAGPLVSTDHANVESAKAETKMPQQDATATMKAISHRSGPTSPVEGIKESLPSPPTLWEQSKPNLASLLPKINSTSGSPGDCIYSMDSPAQLSLPPTPTSTSSRSTKSAIGDPNSHPTVMQGDARATRASDKKQSMSSVSAATAIAAKNWSWNILSRAKEHRQPVNQTPDLEKPGTPERPIGRGQPLPPPGQPLPMPDKASSQKSQNGNATKRKPLPISNQSSRRQSDGKAKGDKPSALPPRRRKSSLSDDVGAHEDLMVVKVPSESRLDRLFDEERESLAEGLTQRAKDIDLMETSQRSDVERIPQESRQMESHDTTDSDSGSRR